MSTQNMDIHVHLDTCVVGHLYSEPQGVELLKLAALRYARKTWAYKSYRLRVSLPDLAFLELAKFFQTSGFDAKRWHKVASKLEAVLDPDLPVFPYDRFGRSMIGLDPPLSAEQIYETKQHAQGVWTRMKNSPNLRAFSHSVELWSDQNDEWKELLDDMEQFRGKVDAIDMAEGMHNDFLNDWYDPIRAAAFRPLLNFLAYCAVHPEYQPNSKRTLKRSDGMDIWLLYSLQLPAIVVTSDGGFIKLLRNSKVLPEADKKGVVSVQTFNKALREVAISELIL